MNKYRLLACLLVLPVLAPAIVVAARFDVPDGDYQALIQAVEQANGTAETDVIVLAPGGSYVRSGGEGNFDPQLVIKTPIIVQGNGAVLTGQDLSGPFFSVEPEGILWLIEINILDANPIFGRGSGPTVLRNAGQVFINRSTIANNTNIGFYASFGLIVNEGELHITNSTFSGNTMAGGYARPVLANFGTVDIENSVFLDNHLGGFFHEGAAIGNNPGTVTFRNTILWNNTTTVEIVTGPIDISSNCVTAPENQADYGGEFISLGGNIASDETCGLDHPDDRIGIDPMLGPLADNGGATLTHLPATDSVVIDGAGGFPRIDQRGRHRVRATDSGPVELDAIAGKSIGSWATGTWFVRAQNGHYFVVEVIGDDLVAAYWLTFDKEGQQRWVYGTGRPEGSSVRLEAHTSQGMRAPNFKPGDRVQTAWGGAELHFKNCNNAWAEWFTGEPGFVPDAAPLRRLTGIGDNPCGAEGRSKVNQTAHWTGTWHVPAKDGHYFVVEGIHSDVVLVYWLTYDETGAPAWVYAVGSPQGNALGADAHITSGMKAPGFDPGDLTQRLWGTVEFEFKNCGKASAAWQPTEPGFHPGSATLRRLTIAEGLGCD